MKNITALFLVLFQMSFAQKIIGKLVAVDPSFKEIIDPNAQIEVLGEGFKWSEGPIWVKDAGYLLFSDVPNNVIHKWKEGEGVTVFLKPSGYTGVLPYGDNLGSNGLIINSKGELVSCEHGDRRIAVMPLVSGGKRTLSDNFQGKKLNSPNDICQKSTGEYYFTDPPYGLPKQENDSSRELDFGVYRINKNGVTALLVNDLIKPNGICFSPDEKYLYVNQSDPKKAYIKIYPVLPNGKLGKGKVFFDATPMVNQGLSGLPDGIRVDQKGTIFSTGPGGVLVLNSTGKLLGRIDPGQPTANCTFGADGYLYLTSNMYLCRIKTKTGVK
jgi:gluconolactonase